MVEVQQDEQQLVGLQLVRTAAQMVVLGADGRLHYLDHDRPATQVRRLDSRFAPQSAVAMRGRLQREFGAAMEVQTTTHFLVVQPKGRGPRWPETFERLHRQFTTRMKRIGVNVRKGRFPMVAVVLPDRATLLDELQRQRIPGANLAGVYVVASNRVYTYDAGANEAAAALLRHEAAHQSAYNSNVHSRLVETPKWLSEGLAMLFEPAAVSAGGSAATRQQRMNPDALKSLRRRYGDSTRSLAADLNRLVGGDEMFSGAEAEDAYAISWLVVHFLYERKPQSLAAMLNHTAARPPFTAYRSAQRRADFQRIIGRSIEQIAVDLASSGAF